MALITTQRAKELIPNFPDDDVGVLTDLVNAASSLIEKYCNRTFAITAWDELLDGTGHPNILLSNYPVVQLDRLLFNPTQVVSIGNSKSTVSRASFRLDATNLYLTAVDNGTTLNRTIARSDCTTLADLATAINAYSGDGWSASALGQYGNWLTADLYGLQGGFEVRWNGQGYLWHHTFGIPALMQDTSIGEVVSSFGFYRGYHNYRCIYSAGFSVIPYEIQQACAELAAALYNQREVNPNLQSENLGGYSYAQITEKSFANLSIASRYAIDQFRNFRIVKNRAL